MPAGADVLATGELEACEIGEEQLTDVDGWAVISPRGERHGRTAPTSNR